jgi:1,4-alpha-glucan branching enzyme
LSSTPAGYLSVVLHCHLPFVRHPEHEYFLEENWFYEALLETYLPLLDCFEKLAEKNIPFKATFSISPTLISMWADPLLQARASRYLDDLAALCAKERERVQNQKAFQPIVERYASKLDHFRRKFTKQYRRNLVEGFKALQETGNVELVSCAATHGYLPLLAVRKEALQAQVETAIQVHQAHFGRKPAGFWLPECGYEPGIEEIIGRYALRYFLVDTHGLLHATPRPRYGSFAPAACPNGVAVFARDLESSKEVWSSKEGYPGDVDYRDFYRDVGFDLDEAYLAPFLKPDGIRRFTGLKYYRVTGPGEPKEPYDPQKGLARAQEHASDFLSKRQAQMLEASRWMDRKPQIVCMYDAELFGHWWHEGPDFIFNLFEKNRSEERGIQFSTLSEYLDLFPGLQTLNPSISSWGFGGYSEFWLNETNDWVYPLLTNTCDEMTEAVERLPKAKGPVRRALNQAARELLLAQASDWAFMLKTGNHGSYAELRVKEHTHNVQCLIAQASQGRVDRAFLKALEGKNNLFPQLDYHVFRKYR